jgi:phage-related baseplate assembly protein
MVDGQLPGQAVLDKVLAACTPKKVRPLTDHVTAAAPTVVPYDITLTYYISQANAADETNIKTAIEGTDGAVDQYKAWQCGQLGRAINPDYLRQLMLNAGARRITLTAPVYTILEDTQVAAAGTVAVTYGGLE